LKERNTYIVYSNIRNQLEQQQLQNDAIKANKKALASKLNKTPAKRIMYCRGKLITTILNMQQYI
jgi:hypothetical protein